MDDLKASETAVERDTSHHVREYHPLVCSTTRIRVIWKCQVQVADNLTYRLNVFLKRCQAPWSEDLISAHVNSFVVFIHGFTLSTTVTDFDPIGSKQTIWRKQTRNILLFEHSYMLTISKLSVIKNINKKTTTLSTPNEHLQKLFTTNWVTASFWFRGYYHIR